MIKKILIANRGEIALRVIKTAKKMNILTVALHTNDEIDCSWAQEADEAINIGEGSVGDTYLNTIRIIQIAINQHCDAIHPGYGFLSENYEFASACEQNNIAFIGPSANSIQLMGNKMQARKFVEKIGISTPKGIVGNHETILKNADKLNYPVIIKAVGGGGGKGMHILNNSNDLNEKLALASSEAEKWFGNKEVYIEQYFESARHIEVQVLADKAGNCVHLFERECTLQRNYQKIIEEAPSPTLNEEQRKLICDAALHICNESGYSSAGTIEFLWNDGSFYFLEMNTRIQVEHPVTESITGIDIIEQQINIANNLNLNLRQKDIKLQGHAVEARIYAENPLLNFKPSAGYMHLYIEPKGTYRIDSTYDKASEISPSYDGLISKVITYENNRVKALESLKKQLTNYKIHGIDHNIEFLIALLSNDQVVNNEIDTNFIKNNLNTISKLLTPELSYSDKILASIASIIYSYAENNDINSVWQVAKQANTIRKQEYMLNGEKLSFVYKIDSNTISVFTETAKLDYNFKHLDKNTIEIKFESKTQIFTVSKSQKEFWVQFNSSIVKISSQHNLNQAIVIKPKSDTSSTKLEDVKSPLHGTISSVAVQNNSNVKQGEILLVIESMKTENQILSVGNGQIKDILVHENQQVKEGQLLITYHN